MIQKFKQATITPRNSENLSQNEKSFAFILQDSQGSQALLYIPPQYTSKWETLLTNETSSSSSSILIQNVKCISKQPTLKSRPSNFTFLFTVVSDSKFLIPNEEN